MKSLEDVALAACTLEVERRDLNDLFETAAGAQAEAMVDPATVETSVERQVALSADKVDLLRYDWPSELIYRKDRDRKVFPQARVRGRGARLTALVPDGVANARAGRVRGAMLAALLAGADR